ncbi:50S ribosomal protein L23 [Metamycoplasma auris 15026]|uniref:Large ribosomal subunit protein uL23 n=1 Tax=Metamycoplasma auris 15026 TaxID=1188233 RepID=N9VAY3_9BACT|nr:50S ribosomal protein L23 [Metamycoplasma auris]ENY68838.1 50S ribosomal protein L23 [Metamycoplasma auris 15026]
MNINQVIKYPILTEKSEIARTNQNVYTFAVDRRTNKIEVKKAVEFIFDVKVLKVNIINYDKKPARLGRFSGFKNAVKKAIVYLDEKSKILLFAEEAKEAKKEVAKETEAKETQEISEAEKKAAEKIKKATEAKLAKENEEAKLEEEK